jgi:leucyl-tRNA synthetase
MDYNPRNIEKKWKKWWDDNQVYKVSNQSSKPKFYVLDMFPYPSGSGLHVGHPLGYIASDIYARFKRMKGFNVLHPMGYDAFGLPAEQYAIQTGVHPAKSTAENIARYRAQLDNLGFSFDWSREVQTCDPKYYKWTQWIFLQLFGHWYDQSAGKARPIEDLIAVFEKNGSENVQAACSEKMTFSAADWKSMTAKQKDDVLMNYRLAYRKVTYVWWCEELGTVLANDEVKDGVSERGGYPVERKPMLQWSLRITAYAERLLSDLNDIEFSDSMTRMQSNWIGKSTGAQMFFDLETPLLQEGPGEADGQIEIFTTRPDTIFGATFMVLAPEHDLVKQITTDAQRKEIDDYLTYVNTRSERDRMAETKEVSGAFTGAYAINPFNNEKIPIWIAEYVLKDYGTGAIMAVPADDERDRRFAEKFGLSIVEIIDKSMHPGATIEDKLGIMINSGFMNGMEVLDAIDAILEKIEGMGIGKKQVNYKLRDAIYSRQRYWGEPFPIVYDTEGVAHPMPLEELPLELPELEDFKPASGAKSPLARAEDWVNLPNGWKRETDTMPGFAGSSWYFLRYMDARNDEEFASQKALNYWRDVDLYVGGTEHAVGHLMYSRFWHKFLFDKGMVPTKEPYKKLLNQGMIQGTAQLLIWETSGSQFLINSSEGNKPTRPVQQSINPESADIYYSRSAWGTEPYTRYKRIPIHLIKQDEDKFYLDDDGIKRLIEWNKEYSNAVFVNEIGYWYKGEFIHTDKTQPNTKETRRIQTIPQVGKMSKSWYNVINPDDVVERYGADCFRMYEMFLGPIEQAKPWDTKGIDGVSKFLRKMWSLFYDENGKYLVTDDAPTKEELKTLHTAIKKVTEDIERFSFNTCVSGFMICVNELRSQNCSKRAILEPLVKLVAPFAPHQAEELWHQLGHETTVCEAEYPTHDDAHLVQDTISYPVSINGKKRDVVDLPAGMAPAELEQFALGLDSVQKWIDGKTVRKVIVVPGRMINIVVV